jgi:glutathione-regulated potassium-efflux system ancillary protein KefG
MARVLVLFAHPRLEKSRANRALLRHLPDDAAITFHDLYETYPDFHVDVAAEQALVLEHDVIVWHHPFYWYSVPPLVKVWIDLVLAFGWAYGPGGTALRGKTVAHVVTTGGAAAAYRHDGFHGSTIDEFMLPLRRTVTLCGMTWLPPFVVHGTNRLSEDELEDHGRQYSALLRGLARDRWPDDRLATARTLNQLLTEAD